MLHRAPPGGMGVAVLQHQEDALGLRVKFGHQEKSFMAKAKSLAVRRSLTSTRRKPLFGSKNTKTGWSCPCARSRSRSRNALRATRLLAGKGARVPRPRVGREARRSRS